MEKKLLKKIMKITKTHNSYKILMCLYEYENCQFRYWYKKYGILYL